MTTIEREESQIVGKSRCGDEQIQVGDEVAASPKIGANLGEALSNQVVEPKNPVATQKVPEAMSF